MYLTATLAMMHADAHHARRVSEANAHPSFRFTLHVDIQPTVVTTISIYGNVHITVANATT